MRFSGKRAFDLLGVFLFIAVLFILKEKLHGLHYKEFFEDIRAFGFKPVFLAFCLTLANYFVLTGYDFLAFRAIRRSLPAYKIGLTSFIANAFSNNFSFSGITSASVRYRFYGRAHLSLSEITQIAIFYNLTFIIGLIALGAVVFLFRPVPLAALPLAFASTLPLGVILSACLLLYFGFILLKKSPVRILKLEIPVPPLRIFAAQIPLSALDWILASGVLYVLLPGIPLRFDLFLGFFLFSQVAGLISQIPGGLGVFDTLMLAFLTPYVPTSNLLAALVVYRVVYYLLPFLMASLLLLVFEISTKANRVKNFLTWLVRRIPEFVPNVLAVTTFIGGVMMLFSGATPSVMPRLIWLKHFLPLPVLEVSHFLGGLVGVGLLLLSRRLQRRLESAYGWTVILLIAGSIFSLLKGFDYEEAITLFFMLLIFLPCRHYFYRKNSLIGEHFTLGWLAAIALALVSSIWFGIFAFQNIQYTEDLLWKFKITADAPRFLRTSAGASAAFLLFFAFRRIFRSSQKRELPPSNLEKISVIISKSSKTYAHLALLGDKQIIMNPAQSAFIMYGIRNRSWVCYGDPVGPEKEWMDLLWRFREECDRYDAWPVFYQIGKKNLDLYLNLGLALLKIGEEARVCLESFSMEGGSKKEFRHLLRHLERDDCRFEIISRNAMPNYLAEFKAISDAWLVQKKVKEKGFSMGSFDEAYLRTSPAAIVRRHGQIIAFTNLWLSSQKEELSNDLMRYLPDSPRNVMDFLILKLVLWGKSEGFRWFNLGMAPLSGLESHNLAPFWNRFGSFFLVMEKHSIIFEACGNSRRSFIRNGSRSTLPFRMPSNCRRYWPTLSGLSSKETILLSDVTG